MNSLTYYPQRTVFDCLLTAVECLLQRPREELPESSHYLNGCLTYSSAAAMLESDEKYQYGVVSPDIVPHLWKESNPMIIGAKLCKGSPFLHAMFWDGVTGWLWDGAGKTFVVQDLRELTISYAIIRADSKNNRYTGHTDWLRYWDKIIHRKTEEDWELSRKADEQGLIQYLEVV